MRRAAMATVLLAAQAAQAQAQAQPQPILPVPLQPVVSEAFRTCTLKTPSGLGYQLLRPGKGRLPTPADVVQLDYIIYSAYSGEVFDQGVDKTFPIAGLVAGVTEGLQLAPQGGVVRLCLPAALAYGDKGAGPIPPDTDLVFQAELRQVITRKELEARARR